MWLQSVPMHRVWVLFAGLALIGAGLVFGLMGHSVEDFYVPKEDVNCGSVLLPADDFWSEEDYWRCQTQLDSARAGVYALLGLGTIVALTGTAWITLGTRSRQKSQPKQVAGSAR
jgi:hypothetical protein